MTIGLVQDVQWVLIGHFGRHLVQILLLIIILLVFM